MRTTHCSLNRFASSFTTIRLWLVSISRRSGRTICVVPELLNLISQGRVRIIADTSYPLAEAKEAFHAIASRQTIGKVVLVP
ncbi:zinc-binding dehydrogenase [Mycobacteroides chelonae]|nr:zinc-binding dehydrogenase [Actinomycetota bacterium]MBV0920251.1 zinc-binding dehydrogenase [Mycobacteroides chelonae]